MKPVSEYTIIGKSYPQSVIRLQSGGSRNNGSTDVALPGMLHARMVHPKTLGSTLVSVGAAGQDAISQRAGHREGQSGRSRRARRNGKPSAPRSRWPAPQNGRTGKGCPATHNLFTSEGRGRLENNARSPGAIRARATWRPRMAGAAKKLSATYEMPFMKHAPIGPTMAVGDARADGTVHIYTHNQNPQALRGEIAQMLGIPMDHIVVRTFIGPGHYGRSNGGNAGGGRRSSHSVEGGRQAGARAMDARRGFPVVDAVAGRVLGHPDRPGREGQNGRLSDGSLHARDAGRPAGRRGDRRAADHAGSEANAAESSAPRPTDFPIPGYTTALPL